MLLTKIKRKLISLINLEINAIYDYLIFKRHFTKSSEASKDKQKLESWILQDKHRIEKAFTLPEPRFSFGKEIIPRLIDNLVEYRKSYCADQVYYIGVGSLKAYIKYHKEHNKKLPDFFINIINKIPDKDFEHYECELAGYNTYSKSVELTENTYASLIRSRRSCRNFDVEKSKEIDSVLLTNIINLSIMAPSVCNRQHWRVHYFFGELKNRVLSFQNGNAGFQDNIPYIAVVTSDLRAFYSPDERNQPYIDGGIFSMNLMYAMQNYGLASCPLNWCISVKTESQFRKLKLIPDNEVVVLVLAFGYPSRKALYAKSPRLSVENFFTVH